MHKFELLAPAGSFEILKAVICAGADAVYVGGNMFGARAYANNFSQEELLDAIDYVHLRGKRLFLTVNTLMKNTEINESLYGFLDVLYKHGLDGVIVQDIGAVKFIHEAFPDLEIHTSTQMTITGVEGARLLKQYGVTRIVMAREVSLEEMKRIHEETGLELEAFVHGALCYCYSGQCLFSSILGGRSGNRGRCAQPCRLMYSVLNNDSTIVKKDNYILSMKDLCGIEDIPYLANAGVFSLKIEGRMKQADYAAGVVLMYRKYIDLFYANQFNKVSEADTRRIADLGNRCGFTNEYYYKHNSTNMVTYEKPSYEKRETNVVDLLDYSKIKINGRIKLHLNEKAYFEVTYNELLACSYGMEVSMANSRPASKEDIVSRLNKTGDTPFSFSHIEVEMDDNIFVPNGALNQLRRDALDSLKNLLLEGYKRDNSSRPNEINEKNKMPSKVSYCAEIQTHEQLLKVLEFEYIDDIYLNVYKYDRENFVDELDTDCRLILSKGKNVYIVFPKIFRNETNEFYLSIQEKLAEMPLKGVVVSNYESLAFAKSYLPHLKLILDHNMYTYNNFAIEAFEEMGAQIHTIPLELNKSEILHCMNENAEMIVYGHYPLMISAQCVHKNCVGCDKKKTIMYLKDRYNVLFPVRNHCEECYNIIYNSVPTLLSTQIDSLIKAGISRLRLSFTIENEKETEETLRIFEKQLDGTLIDINNLRRKFTNGHFKRGVE